MLLKRPQIWFQPSEENDEVLKDIFLMCVCVARVKIQTIMHGLHNIAPVTIINHVEQN